MCVTIIESEDAKRRQVTKFQRICNSTLRNCMLPQHISILCVHMKKKNVFLLSNDL